MKKFYFLCCLDGYIEAKDEDEAREIIRKMVLIQLPKERSVSNLALTNIHLKTEE